jgi:hypothetical protein
VVFTGNSAGLRTVFSVTEVWRKLHKEDLHGLYCSPIIVRVITSRTMRWTGYVARLREGRGVWAPQEKRSLGRPRCRWKDNIKMDLQGMGCGVMEGIGVYVVFGGGT